MFSKPGAVLVLAAAAAAAALVRGPSVAAGLQARPPLPAGGSGLARVSWRRRAASPDASRCHRVARPRKMELRAGPSPGTGGGEGLNQEAKLLISVLIDLVGILTFALPGLGEAGDVAWAPVSALLVQYLYGNAALTGLALVEELLPGADFIPTATIGWFLTYGRSRAAAPDGAQAATPERREDDDPRRGTRSPSGGASSPPPPGIVVDVETVEKKEKE